jgi:hypothetical protein
MRMFGFFAGIVRLPGAERSSTGDADASLQQHVVWRTFA